MSKKSIGVLILVTLSVAVFVILPKFDHSAIVEKSEEIPARNIVDSMVCAPEPTLLYGMVVDSLVIIENKIKRNQNIAEILSAHNVSNESIFKLAKISKEVFDVRKLVVNRKYTLICQPDSLLTANTFVYEPNPTEYVIFNVKDTISVEMKQRDIKVIEKGVAGVIESNLAMTMSDIGLSPQLTDEFVDIFAWQIDFFRLHKGDKFKLIYEEQSADGVPIGIGKIKSIFFEHKGNPFYAFYYDQEGGIDYFDEHGNSLRKALLKYPLDFTRISSRYTGRRFHPVQKRWKAHRGTDFAAPRGTPIRSVGDGVILQARYQKYNGNYVKIKHNATYTTQYLHMSKIRSGITSGKKVKQGEIIGYVGSTGLARGNHLCYRFWKNGVQIDALKVNLPPSAPIDPDNIFDFDATKISMLNKLSQITFKEDKKTILASVK